LKSLKQFKIPFKGLCLGTHFFDWEIDKKFFEAIENPDVLDCSVVIKLELEKQERMMILDFTISGFLKVSCDRCLEAFNLPVKIQEKYFIKFGEEYKEESESILVIPESEYQVDLSELVFDYISLSIPIKKIHPDDNQGDSMCNEDTLAKLNELTGKKGDDPRWEVLKI